MNQTPEQRNAAVVTKLREWIETLDLEQIENLAESLAPHQKKAFLALLDELEPC